MTEVTFRGRRRTRCALDAWTRKDSWQVQGIVSHREVVSCGRGECRCHIGIRVWADVVWRSWNRETAWQGCVMCVLRWVFPLDFWRMSRTKRSFCRLRRVSF